ncbi:hypothetical protein NL676_013021 [Syzygium grande]|nr:hypothetical protein NL676_013021 [Syzygium grande]
MPREGNVVGRLPRQYLLENLICPCRRWSILISRTSPSVTAYKSKMQRVSPARKDSSLGPANRYVAIWYNQVSVVSVIWVANRDKPLKDSSGTVKIYEDSNNVVSNGQNEVLCPYWRSGPWNGLVFIGVPDMSSVYLKGFTLADDKEGTIYLTYTVVNQSFLSNFALNPEGNLVGEHKSPALAEWSSGDNCGDRCLANCSCIAFAYFYGLGCMIWTGNLIDIHKFSEGGIDLYIRVADSELNKNRNVKVIIFAMAMTGVVATSVFTFFLCRCMAKSKAASKELLLSRREKAY